tara:strand:- start:365 stop:877 length:513 start_codon:yes stop_codon:yes gene_type:complete
MNYVFKRIEKKDFSEVLRLRNQLKVRNASLIKKKISKKEHYAFLKLNFKKKIFYAYKLVYNKKIVGIATGLKIGKSKKYIRWSIYKNFKVKTPLKIGSILLFNLIEKLFSKKDIKYLRCEVLKNNKFIKKWYIKWGCKINKKYKNKKYYVLDLNKKKWQKLRKQIKTTIK